MTAWDGDTLVGIARALTDFAYATYLSDLAVRVSMVLLAAPAARGGTTESGFTQHHPLGFYSRKNPSGAPVARAVSQQLLT